MSGKWEAIRSRGRIIYWRFATDAVPGGAVSKRDSGWRALRYGPEPTPHIGRRELGYFTTWQAARRAVENDVKANPGGGAA